MTRRPSPTPMSPQPSSWWPPAPHAPIAAPYGGTPTMAVSSTPTSRPRPPPAAQAARRGPVGARPPRAAEPQRADQEGRRPAQRPGPDREHLRPPRLRLHRPGRPARPVPLVGPLHPAQGRASTAAAPRSSSRTSSTTSTSCCGSASTAASSTSPSCARSPSISTALRPRHRRHHRPAEHPAALDPGRGHAGDLAPARGGRPADHRGVRRHARGWCWAARSPASPPTR